MAEYIDREEAKTWIANWLRVDKNWHPYSKGKNILTAEVFDMLSLIPAADVQPVKHGRWINIMPDVEYKSFCQVKCSVCESIEPYGNFCPNCGADMRETNDEKA